MPPSVKKGANRGQNRNFEPWKGKKEGTNPRRKLRMGPSSRRWLARSMDACVESFSLGDCFIASRQNEQFGNGHHAKDDDVRIKSKT